MIISVTSLRNFCSYVFCTFVKFINGITRPLIYIEEAFSAEFDFDLSFFLTPMTNGKGGVSHNTVRAIHTLCGFVSPSNGRPIILKNIFASAGTTGPLMA